MRALELHASEFEAPFRASRRVFPFNAGPDRHSKLCPAFSGFTLDLNSQHAIPGQKETKARRPPPLPPLPRGNVPAVYLWATYGGVQFGMYEHLQRVDFLRANAVSRTQDQDRGRAHERYRDGRESDGRGGPARGVCDEDGGRSSGGLPTAVSNFVYGAIAGCSATFASYPFDITRTALASQVRISEKGGFQGRANGTFRCHEFRCSTSRGDVGGKSTTAPR